MVLAVACFGCASALATAQEILPAEPESAAAGDGTQEVYNTLWVTDAQAYATGNGDAWSGHAVFGDVYDLQACDEVELTADAGLHSTTRDYLTFSGAAPCEGVQIGVYRGSWAGRYCVPVEEAHCDFNLQQIDIHYFSDSIFGLVGMRLRVIDETGRCRLTQDMTGDRIFFIDMQPKCTDETGDWYYVVVDISGLYGCGEAHFRDGGRGRGGTGCTTWCGSCCHYRYNLAMAVSVRYFAPASACTYEVFGIRMLRDCNGEPCTTCPLELGKVLCGAGCEESAEPCPQELLGFEVCARGGACRTRAVLRGCEDSSICRACP